MPPSLAWVVEKVVEIFFHELAPFCDLFLWKATRDFKSLNCDVEHGACWRLCCNSAADTGLQRWAKPNLLVYSPAGFAAVRFSTRSGNQAAVMRACACTTVRPGAS